VNFARPVRFGTVLMLDSTDQYGHADDGAAIDAEELARLITGIRETWPDQPLLVSRWSHALDQPPVTDSAPPGADALTVTRDFTDVKRLVGISSVLPERWLVVRPSVLLLPAQALRAAVEWTIRHTPDLVTLDGVAADVFYVASARAVAMVAALGGVPGCVTLPQALERLTGAGGADDEGALRVTRLTPRDIAWPDQALVSALDPRGWRSQRLGPLLALPSSARLAEALRRQQHALGDARSALRAQRDVTGAATPTDRREVLVVVPSMYQSGAQAAWAEVAGYLSPAQAAFVVGRSTVLQGILQATGFRVFEVGEGLAATSAADAATFFAALDAVRPAVVHFDGAEGNTWAPAVFSRGVRIVQHVRLNAIDRFRPVFAYADAVVGVSPHVVSEIAARVGTAVRVEHIPDGVDAAARAPAAAMMERAVLTDERTVQCLCVGRVEPAKGQLRVLEIVQHLGAHRRCRLVIVGPCGSDPAYCDAVSDRIRAAPPDTTISWRPFTYPIADLYQQAHVVLVGSRNEALGMVGLETLAAGGLLVAQRSTGYECIIDASTPDGLLYDSDEPASRVAERIAAALQDFGRYSVNARRKAAACFGASESAARLSRLWREVGGRG